jgi:hypothetical protein
VTDAGSGAELVDRYPAGGEHYPGVQPGQAFDGGSEEFRGAERGAEGQVHHRAGTLDVPCGRSRRRRLRVRHRAHLDSRYRGEELRIL